MGREVALGAAMLTVVSCLMLVIGSVMPMHKLSLHIFMRDDFLGVVDTYLTTISWSDVSAGNFQTIVADLTNEAAAEPFEPSRLAGSHGLAEMYEHLCNPGLKHAWPGWCDGLAAAGPLGATVLALMIIDLIVQTWGCYQLYLFAFGRLASARRKELAAGVVLLSSLVMLITLLAYVSTVVGQLDHISKGEVNLLSADENSGLGPGFTVMTLAVCLQLGEGFVMLFTKAPAARASTWNKDPRGQLEDCVDMFDGEEFSGGVVDRGERPMPVSALHTGASVSPYLSGAVGAQPSMAVDRLPTQLGGGVGHERSMYSVGRERSMAVGAQPSMYVGHQQSNYPGVGHQMSSYPGVGHQQSMYGGGVGHQQSMYGGGVGHTRSAYPGMQMMSGSMGVGAQPSMAVGHQQTNFGGGYGVGAQPSMMAGSMGLGVMMQPSQMNVGGQRSAW